MGSRTIDKVAYVKGLHSSWKKGRGYRPLNVMLLITGRCNARCVMCNIWKLSRGKPETAAAEMSTQDHLNLLTELSEMGTKSVYISGGEPLLRKDILQIARYAKKEMRFECVEIDTNGALLSQAVAEELVEAGLDVIHFSVDGPTAETHNNLRGVNDSWERAIEAIRTMNRAKKKSGVGKPSIAIGYVVSTMNHKYINQMLDLKPELGYDTLHLMPVLSKTPEAQSLLLTDSDLDALEAQLPSLAAKCRSLCLPAATLSPLIRMARSREDTKTGTYADSINRRVLCFTPWVHAVVDPVGDVYPCCSGCPLYSLSKELDILWGADRLCMGNVRNGGFHEVWNSENYRRFREKMRGELPSYQFCRWCSYRSTNEAVLTGLFRDRSLLLKIAFSRLQQRLGRTEGFEWDFLYK